LTINYFFYQRNFVAQPQNKAEIHAAEINAEAKNIAVQHL